jgi:hypothetical protein
LLEEALEFGYLRPAAAEYEISVDRGLCRKREEGSGPCEEGYECVSMHEPLYLEYAVFSIARI